MTVETIKKLPRSVGHKHTNSFLETTWKKSVAHCKNFYGQSWDIPFRYSERSAASALLSGMSAAGACVLPEIPGQRKLRGQPVRNARIDAWAMYDNVEYYIEFKHCWYNLGRDSNRTDLVASWNKMLEQIEGMRTALRGSLDYPFWVCGMMIVPAYKNAKNEQQAKNIDDAWHQLFANESFYSEADWVGRWHVKDDMALVEYKDHNGNDRFSYQPSVSLLVKAQYVEPKPSRVSR